MAITDNTETVSSDDLIIEQRKLSKSVGSFFRSKFAAIPLAVIGLLMISIPGTSLVLFPIALAYLLPQLFLLDTRFPFKIPKSSGIKADPKTVKAGTENGKNAAEAITCLGVDRETQRQYWLTSDDERRHTVLIATTGSGKTFTLRFYFLMTLIQGTGAIAIDGKGDLEFSLALVNTVRRFVREDDLQLLNFKQGAENIYTDTSTPRTNTFNPFSSGSATYIAEILKSLCTNDSPDAKGGDLWEKRGASMCEIIAKITTTKRDFSGFKIRPKTISDTLTLRGLCQSYIDPLIDEKSKIGLKIYFDTLPDFELDHVEAYANGQEFAGKILEQHGYVGMQLQPALQVLSEQYGYIFDTDYPDIHLKDTVLNNRLLIGMLPAMEQSEKTLANTGKIILAAMKGMIAGELGEKYEGNINDILTRRAANDVAPFKVFLDECGYYAAIRGIEILPAQGRGLGFAFYFIAQTYADLEKGGKDVADIIWGNANNKTIGKAETESTYNKIKDRLSDKTVLIAKRKKRVVGSLLTTHHSSDDVDFESKARLKMSDLTSLTEGKFFQIANDSLIKLATGNPLIKENATQSRYNQYVPISDLSDEVKKSLTRNLKPIKDRFRLNAKGEADADEGTLLAIAPTVLTLANTLVEKYASTQHRDIISIGQGIVRNTYEQASIQEEKDNEDSIRELLKLNKTPKKEPKPQKTTKIKKPEKFENTNKGTKPNTTVSNTKEIQQPTPDDSPNMGPKANSDDQFNEAQSNLGLIIENQADDSFTGFAQGAQKQIDIDDLSPSDFDDLPSKEDSFDLDTESSKCSEITSDLVQDELFTDEAHDLWIKYHSKKISLSEYELGIGVIEAKKEQNLSSSNHLNKSFGDYGDDIFFDKDDRDTSDDDDDGDNSSKGAVDGDDALQKNINNYPSKNAKKMSKAKPSDLDNLIKVVSDTFDCKF